ncbi:MAG TPA: ubiquinol-cytochrome C chaperone family protein [Dongiaceae bacterium]
MSILQLFRRRRSNEAAIQLHLAIVTQARQPAFYTALGVPDTLDGRFELIALHGFLVMQRLKADPAGIDLARDLAETIFDDLDASLREMGAGDLGVGKRVKKMGEAFYGRIAAYDAGLAGGGDLRDALRRNLYGTVQPTAETLAAAEVYVRNCFNTLKKCDFSGLLEGILSLPAPPADGVPLPARH